MELLKKLFAPRQPATTGKVLRRSFLVTVAFHLALLAAAAVWVVGHVFYNRESTFVGQPAPMRSYDPRQLEFKVKVSKQQRSSSRPSMAPRLAAMKTSALALPEIKIDAKMVKTSFQPKFKSVGGTGLGVGLGTGYGVGGFGTGVSQFDFFGIRGRGDRIAILVDVSVSMLEEQRGGPAGFVRVKNRINEVIDKLNEAAMFNVVVFADAASRWQDRMVIANEENRQQAKAWLAPFNTGSNEGLASGNYFGVTTGIPALGGTTRLDLALAAAYEGGADTVLVISDGLPCVEKGEDAAYAKTLQEWNRKHAKEIAEAREAQAEARWEDQKVWIPDQPAAPRREGQPARAAVKGHWEMIRVQVNDRPGGRAVPPPPPAAMQQWSLEDFVAHLATLYGRFYVPKGRKAPVIHCIGYQTTDADGKFLRDLTNKYQGRYRRISQAR